MLKSETFVINKMLKVLIILQITMKHWDSKMYLRKEQIETIPFSAAVLLSFSLSLQAQKWGFYSFHIYWSETGLPALFPREKISKQDTCSYIQRGQKSIRQGKGRKKLLTFCSMVSLPRADIWFIVQSVYILVYRWWYF